ncbi:hypothetical protein GGF32_003798 [Allomyces javanicus]|nr:hypothetical protein GGF32_003798 [Allomyces javanicus]
MNSVLNYLPAYGTTTPARKADGSWLYDSATYSFCSNGMFVPPQCQANPSSCRDTGENEQRIVTLGLKVVVVYLGTDFDSNVVRPARVGTSSNALTCDMASELLMKISTASLRSTAQHVSMFFKQFSLKDHDINYLLNDYATTGVTETTACKWVTTNRNLWTAWITPPPAKYIKTLDAMASSEVLPILVAVLCALIFAATLPTFHLLSQYAGTATIKAQSPPFMQLIALGVLIVAVSVALEIASPTITGMCAVRVWLLALGMCTILGSIIVKTTRIFLIFGGTAITGILAICHALQLLVACWLSFKIRNVGTTYNESKYIALAAYNILLACIVVVPVAALPINFRAQFVIKSVCILLALGGVLGLLVWRPIVEVLLSSAVSTDVLASFKPPSSTTKLDRGMSLRNVMAKSDKGDEGVLCGLEARVGQRYAIKQMGGVFRKWIEVDIVLFHHPLPSLQITPCGSPKGGQAFTFKVFASLADGAPDCFILRVGGSSYLVQAKDAVDADRWVHDIETTFKAVNASTTGTVSRASSGNSAAASATTAAAPDQSVASRRPPGPQRSGMAG